MLISTRVALIAAVLLAACLLIAVGSTAPAAAASPAKCWQNAAGDQVCEVTSISPGSPGGGGPGGGSSGPAATCEDSFPSDWCAAPSGAWWSNGRQCWVAPLSPQPPAGDPLWQGRTTGTIYQCRAPESPAFRGTADVVFFWSDTEAQPVDPAVLAQTAIDSMELTAPTVGATPLPGPDAVSLIGLPTWLWVQSPGTRSWGPITATASAGGVTTTATAKVARVVWDMGDGSTITCTNPGTAWTPAQGTGDSPTCGYRYRTPGQRTITATTHWQVDWSGAGQTGTIPLALSGTRQIDVTQLRAVISR
jgi:hypothetical protein